MLLDVDKLVSTLFKKDWIFHLVSPGILLLIEQGIEINGTKSKRPGNFL